MGTIFSAALTRSRKEAGFATAYRFYHDNGGKPVLKISYRMYLMMEQGKRLPAFENLAMIIYALRLVPGSHSATLIILSFLKTLLGESGFTHLLEPLLKPLPGNPISSPLHKVISRSLTQAKYHITPKQLGVIAKDKYTYHCWLAMSNDDDKWTAEALAARINRPEPGVRSAFKDLTAAGLLKRAPDGTYKCPMAGAMVEFPHGNTVLETQQRLQALSSELADSGKLVYLRKGTFRASHTELTNFFPLMSLNISAAHTYAITKKAEKSALFEIEGRIVKICDF